MCHLDGMATQYAKWCPVARTLNLVGERWTLLIVRDLLLSDTRRFADLMESVEGIGPGVLSARLKHLESAGLVESRLYSRHPPRAEYALTAKGRALGPVVLALKSFGEQHT